VGFFLNKLMKISKMEKADIPTVALLAEQLGYPSDLQKISERFNKIMFHPDYALFVAKSDTQEITGWIQINKETMSLIEEAHAEVTALVVSENFRGHGIGKSLLKKAEAWARENQIKLIRLRSNVKRIDAHRFYLREGYETSKVSNLFTKIL
jgi:GNAT superfamily N-acetyltransferase